MLAAGLTRREYRLPPKSQSKSDDDVPAIGHLASKTNQLQFEIRFNIKSINYLLSNNIPIKKHTNVKKTLL